MLLAMRSLMRRSARLAASAGVRKLGLARRLWQRVIRGWRHWQLRRTTAWDVDVGQAPIKQFVAAVFILGTQVVLETW